MPSVPAEDADVPKEPDGTGASGEEEPGGDWEEGETAVLYIGTRAGGFTKYPFTYFSYFDTGKRPSGAEPERFCYGFVLGLMVELGDRYVLTSNRESP
mgnify:CR=1 FL=1